MNSYSSNVPVIVPVPDGILRPLWSVMIPTFNCARFLEQTLVSVLKQAPPVYEMEIVVVDDQSTLDDPEEITVRIGEGRVRFHKNRQNLGATKNFNNCINLSRGKLVHILHGDDFLDDGFYSEILSLFRQGGGCAFAATRTIAVEEDGSPIWISPRIRSLEGGGKDANEFLYEQFFQTPSVVVPRSFYEMHGGFNEVLQHVADWEMWVRAIHEGGGVVSSKSFAKYRLFQGNDTARLVRLGENVLDELKLIDTFNKFEGFNAGRFRELRAKKALDQSRRFRKIGDREAYLKNRRIYDDLRSPAGKFADMIRKFGSQILR